MSYRRDLKRLRRARQRHALTALELEGIVTLTLHSVAHSLTLALQPETWDELIDLLLGAIRQRRLTLGAEAARTKTGSRRWTGNSSHPSRKTPVLNRPAD